MKISIHIETFAMLLFLVLVFFASKGITAAQCDLSVFEDQETALSIPMEDYDPVDVELLPTFVKLGPVNGEEYSFYADFYLKSSWYDQDLADLLFETSDDYVCRLEGQDAYGKFWRPGLEFLNSRSLDETGYDKFTISSDGFIQNERRVQGYFGADLNFKKFPFDSQVLSISIIPYFDDTMVTLRGLEPAEEWTRSLNFSDWKMTDTSGSATSSNFKSSSWENNFSTYNISVSLQRIPNYYVIKILTPVFIMAILALASFLLSPTTEDYDTRTSLTVTLLLTVVAYTFIAGDDLPILSYLTFTDIFLVLSFMACVLAVVAILAERSFKVYRERKLEVENTENFSVDDFLERIDRYLGVFFTVIYLGSLTLLYIWM